MRNEIVAEKLIGYAVKIESYCKDTDYDAFRANSLLVEACVFNLSQMGELVNRVDEDYRAMHPDVPWKYIYALRNRIVHDYEGANLRLIWEIITDDLGPLKEALRKIIA